LILTDNVSQNGYDCGPDSSACVLALLENGVQFDKAGLLMKPTIPCGHQTRLRMLAFLEVEAFRSYRMWEYLSPQRGDIWNSGPILEDLPALFKSGSFIRTIRCLIANLTKAQVKCKRCHSKIQMPENVPTVQAQSLHTNLPSSSESGSQSGLQYDSDANPHTGMRGLPRNLKKFKFMKGARNRQDLAPRRSIHSKKNCTIPIPPQRFIPLPSNANFDEYYLGPTIEDCLEYPKYLDNFPTNPFAKPTRRSCWEYFKDYGYRLEPSFPLMFNNEEPILVKEHTLPVGIRQSVSDSPQIARGSTNQKVTVNNVLTMGLDGMIAEAGQPGSEQSFDVFVRGISKFGDYIKLDVKEDAVDLQEDEIITTYDIDSMIWVTHKLQFKQATKVFVLPYEGKKAPIHRNNHTYVEILMPRSDEDKASRRRSEWFSKSFPLSAIPHTHFAQTGEGAGSINIYVFFPRMIHRDEFTGRRVTLIPYPVQDMWFTEVVLPAIIAATVPGYREYVDFTLNEWRWRASNNKRFYDTKTTPVRSSALVDMQECMRRIIEDNPDDLDLFGSFFFVSDIRGCKGLTYDPNPYEALMKEYPSMDWNYAMKRSNGQILLDIGIAFHPNPTQPGALTGLWKLDSLQASYDAAGMNKGTTHHSCTLRDVGGLQADMEQIRSRAVQLPFLSSYQLSFEAIRQPGVDEYFCEDSEAYDASPVFKDSCDKYVSIYKGAIGKSYGVRHEIRGSGAAVREILIHAEESVCVLRLSQVDALTSHNSVRQEIS